MKQTFIRWDIIDRFFVVIVLWEEEKLAYHTIYLFRREVRWISLYYFNFSFVAVRLLWENRIKWCVTNSNIINITQFTFMEFIGRFWDRPVSPFSLFNYFIILTSTTLYERDNKFHFECYHHSLEGSWRCAWMREDS